MSFLSYTIFADAPRTQVRQIANLFGAEADKMLQTMRDVGKCEPHEGQIIAGCRIPAVLYAALQVFGTVRVNGRVIYTRTEA